MDINSFESTLPSLTSKVIFVDVHDHYSYNEDLVCSYKLVDCVPQEHDRVGIYKIGWLYTKDYILFEWAPVNVKEDIVTVIFNRPSLPKNSGDIYQFCYISGENAVYGASSSFQFCSDIPKMYSLTSERHISLPHNRDSGLGSLTTDSSKKDQEIAELKEENALLKETLKMIVYNKNTSHLQKEMDELKVLVKMMKEAFVLQQNELNNLKNKVYLSSKGCCHISELGDLQTLPPFPLSK